MFKISFANSLSPCDNILKLNSLFFSRVTSTRYPGNELNKYNIKLQPFKFLAFNRSSEGYYRNINCTHK